MKFYRGRGCEECRFTGFKGRSAIYEILVMSEALRPLIIERASSQRHQAGGDQPRDEDAAR